MQIGDIYKHKETDSLIQIDSFAHYMNKIDSELIIVFVILKGTMSLKLVIVQVKMDMAVQKILKGNMSC